MRDSSAGGLNWQEGAGLTIAVAAHIALLVVFSLAPPGKKIQPPPEPMEVTFSDQVSDQSTSPDPAAQAAPDVAPELGEPQPEPEPVVEPAPPPPQPAPPRPAPPKPVAKPQPPQPRPAPPKPAAKPSPAKSAAAKPVTKPADASPRRRPDAPSGASRIGSDFLSGLPNASNPGTAKTPPAATMGPEVKASLASAISRQIKPRWAAPQGVDTDKLVTVLAWDLNEDGTLAGRPRVVSQQGITPANEAQAKRHAEQAIRAVQLAAPFDLPAMYYSGWKRIAAFRFDRKLSQ